MVLIEPRTHGSSYKTEQAATRSSRSNTRNEARLSKVPGKPMVLASEGFIRSRGLEAGKTNWRKDNHTDQANEMCHKLSGILVIRTYRAKLEEVWPLANLGSLRPDYLSL